MNTILLILAVSFGETDDEMDLANKFFECDDCASAALVFLGWPVSIYFIYVLTIGSVPRRLRERRESKACDLLNS